MRQRLGRVLLAARHTHRRHESRREYGRGAQTRAGGQVGPGLELDPASARRELLCEGAALGVGERDRAAEEEDAPS